MSRISIADCLAKDRCQSQVLFMEPEVRDTFTTLYKRLRFFSASSAEYLTLSSQEAEEGLRRGRRKSRRSESSDPYPGGLPRNTGGSSGKLEDFGGFIQTSPAGSG